MGGEVPSVDVVVLLGGGIGAGKSSIAVLFAERAFEVIEADVVGHAILADDPDVMAQVVRRWPEVVVGGAIDRRALGAIVFSDPDALDRLEQITHPRIVAAIAGRIASTDAGRVVVETPLAGLLIEGEAPIDEMRIVRVAVVADRDVRRARAVMRGGDPADVERRMRTQDDDATWRAWADHVIDNSGSWAATERTTVTLIEGIIGNA